MTQPEQSFSTRTIIGTNRLGRKVFALDVPTAIADRVDHLQRDGAVIRITRREGYSGQREFMRVELLFKGREKGPLTVKTHQMRGHHAIGPAKPRPVETYWLYVFACFEPLVFKKRATPKPAVPALPAFVPQISVYVERDAALDILARADQSPPLVGEMVGLPGGLTLTRGTDPTLLRPWLLRGPESAIEVTLACSGIPKRTGGPGPGRYQYAAVRVHSDPATGSHAMRLTNDRAFAARIVRSWTREARAELAQGVIVEGLFEHGDHWLAHAEYLRLTHTPAKDSSPDTRAT